ncbi:iron complex transport system substrate-binding protein [Noviherbaspirillum humi]|uniref:Iron complex transport system substrate-binding protein n=1 Tax=Noviherbaspirillum humi TaxID=1688639 RepID=A0A239GQD5_9BURK|nr:cobalamin-binding protein [Noviherbaspirillum humi]SNS71347.1 iron complex transport system substrate-binding protein [Noviherbaspirillum humi]
MTCWFHRCAAILLAVAALPALAEVSARDDAGNEVRLAQPARRVVSLSPHATELLFAASAGERIVGAVDYSDYPPAARRIPRVGDNQHLDIERILALKPDLLVAWLHGAAAKQLDSLRRLGIPIFQSEPRRLADIPDSVARLGALLGTDAQAKAAAGGMQGQIERLTRDYGAKPKVRVFYQVWERPLYTLNGQHIVSDAIRLCGGENVFGGLSVIAPMVSAEAVLLENPEAIISADKKDRGAISLEHWKQYPGLTAARRGNLFILDADEINRAGPRMIDAAGVLCNKLELARSRRKDVPPR